MISVIIPAYNCESTIERAVDSVLAQAYADFELIIVNDGSIDQTEKIVRQLELQDKRIKVFTTENNGEGKARNRGLDEAKGEYISFIDSDDYVAPDFLQTLVHSAGEGVVPCVGVAEEGSDVSLLSELSEGAYEIGKDVMEGILIGRLKDSIAYAVWNKLFDAEVIRSHSLRFFGNYKVGEDLLFTLRYLCYCQKIDVVNKPLYYYCYNASSAIRSKANDLLPAYDMLLKKLDQFNENGYTISEDALRKWAFESLIVALCNGYPLCLTTQEFRNYCEKQLFISRIYQFAMEYKGKVSFQRLILRAALQRKQIMLLRLLIKRKSKT